MHFRDLLADPISLVAFGFGAGCSARAPGTVGTLAAVAFYLPLSQLAVPVYVLVCVVAFALGCWLCGHGARRFGIADHPGIVFDEFVGFWVTMIAAPAGWVWIAIGFGLFRLFDIAKPWPVSWLDEKVKGGLGIMLDDLAAGLFALGCLQALALGSRQFQF